MKPNLFLVSCALIVALGVLSGGNMQAQQSQSSGSTGASHAPMSRAEQAKMWYGEKLNGPVALPNLPDFSRYSKFIEGFLQPNHQGGPMYKLSYASVYSPAEVIRWYTSALSGQGWKIDEDTSSANTIEALRDGNFVSVDVRPSLAASKGFKAVLQIHYHRRRG